MFYWRRLVMNKLDEAREILKEIGMPKAQQSDLCAYTLLALLQLMNILEYTILWNL